MDRVDTKIAVLAHFAHLSLCSSTRGDLTSLVPPREVMRMLFRTSKMSCCAVLLLLVVAFVALPVNASAGERDGVMGVRPHVDEQGGGGIDSSGGGQDGGDGSSRTGQLDDDEKWAASDRLASIAFAHFRVLLLTSWWRVYIH